MKHTLKWFTNRIGKRIYRKVIDCTGCKSFNGPCTEGSVKIHDEDHAKYLAMIQCDLDIDYFDKPIK